MSKAKLTTVKLTKRVFPCGHVPPLGSVETQLEGLFKVPTAHFCHVCGGASTDIPASVLEIWFCGRCKNGIEKKWQYCSYCGDKVEGIERPKEVSPTTAPV